MHCRRCTLFEKIAREGGLPAPESCSMCLPPCPSNIGTSIVDFTRAFKHDVATAIELARICLGPNGFQMCVCNVFMLLKPAWMDNLQDPISRCQSGSDVFLLIMDRILLAIVDAGEAMLNRYTVDPLNKILRFIPGAKLDRICIPGTLFGLPVNYKRCPRSDDYWESYLGCSLKNTHNPHKLCYFRRQRAICMANDNKATEYKALFEAPTARDLTKQFHAITGDAYETLPPTMLQAFEQVDALQSQSGIGYNPEASQICDNSLENSMSLDELILSCVFHWIEGYCSDKESPERFDTFIKTIDWRLPDVVWDWSAAPPPPPPISNSGPFRRLVGGDPEGVELVREKLLECWPPLNYVASQVYGKLNSFFEPQPTYHTSERACACAGSNVGRDRSTDGRGYGPV